MRRLKAGLLVGVAVASTLLLARHAAHRLVYATIYEAELSDFYGRPPQTTFAEVRDHFAEVIEHLGSNEPSSPFYPIARIIGVIDVPTILGAGLILGLAGMIWKPKRHPQPAAATPTPED